MLGNARGPAWLIIAAGMLWAAAPTARAAEILRPDTVVVTARKVSERSYDVPNSLTVLDRASIVRQNVKVFADLQRLVPNLTLTEYNNDPQALTVSLRGQNQADILLTTDGSVGVYLDGVTIPRSIGLNTNLLDIERVEILRGPQGTLQGRNTTGGAINIITRAPDQDFGGFVRGTVGRFHTAAIAGAINVPVSQKAALRIVGQVGSRGAVGRDGSGAPLRDEESYFIRGRLRLEPSDTLTIDLAADWQRNQGGGGIPKLVGFVPSGGATVNKIAVDNGIPLPLTAEGRAAALEILASYIGGDPLESAGTSPSLSFSRASGARVTVDWELSNSVSLRSISGYRSVLRRSDVDVDATPSVILYPRLATDADVWSQELQLLGRTREITWIVGSYFSREHGLDGSRTIALEDLNPTNPSINDGTITNRTVAGFAHVSAPVIAGFNISAGLRWNAESKRLTSRNRDTGGCRIAIEERDDPAICQGTFVNHYRDWSYSFSIDRHIGADTLAYLKTARSVRGGGQNLRGTSVLGSFAAYLPETATDYEIGIKTTLLDGRLNLTGALFYTDYNDVQRSVTIATPTGSLVSVITNAAQAHLYGGELEIAWRPTAFLGFSLAVGHVHGVYDRFEDAQIGDRSNEAWPAPRWTVGLAMDYTVPTRFGAVSLHLDYRWQDDMVLQPAALRIADVTQPAYGVLNGRLNVGIDGWNADISLFVKNITNERYAAAALTLDRTLGYNLAFTGDPRMWGFQIQYRFGGG